MEHSDLCLCMMLFSYSIVSVSILLRLPMTYEFHDGYPSNGSFPQSRMNVPNLKKVSCVVKLMKNIFRMFKNTHFDHTNEHTTNYSGCN